MYCTTRSLLYRKSTTNPFSGVRVSVATKILKYPQHRTKQLHLVSVRHCDAADAWWATVDAESDFGVRCIERDVGDSGASCFSLVSSDHAIKLLRYWLWSTHFLMFLYAISHYQSEQKCQSTLVSCELMTLALALSVRPSWMPWVNSQSETLNPWTPTVAVWVQL